MPKSRGRSPDSFYIKYFEKNLHLFFKPLTDIFNDCFTNSVFPALWKIATTAPTCKVPEPLSPLQVRPITNEYHLSKSFGKMISSRIINFLEKHNYLSVCQSGFPRHFSTQTALLDLIDQIKYNMEMERVALIKMLDFSLAFNSLRHFFNLDFARMCNYSGKAIWFIFNYLINRLF